MQPPKAGGGTLKKTIIIICTTLAFLTIYTIAFQLYFGPPQEPEFSFEMSEEARTKKIQGMVDSLEDDNAFKYYLMAILERPDCEIADIFEEDDFWERFWKVAQEGWQGAGVASEPQGLCWAGGSVAR